MNLKHEQIEYEFSDEHSESDGIMLGYLQTGLDTTIIKFQKYKLLELRTLITSVTIT